MVDSETVVHSMDTDLLQRHVVTGSSDSIVRIYSIGESGLDEILQLKGHDAPVTKAVFINQGELIASVDFGGKLVLWKMEGKGFFKKAEMQLLSGPVYDIAARYSTSEMVLFAACDHGILKKVTADGMFNISVEDSEIHRYGICSVGCNDKYVVTGGLDQGVALILPDGPKFFNKHKTAVNAVAVAPSNAFEKLQFASCAEDGKLFVYEMRGEEFHIQEIEIGEPCYSLSWSKPGFVLTLGYGEGSFKSFIEGEDGQYKEVDVEKISE
ncbi:protein transport protein SEC13 [Enteropsectra breve]|nr:protein transport protein SEC13 [Enteropsectra breve]